MTHCLLGYTYPQTYTALDSHSPWTDTPHYGRHTPRQTPPRQTPLWADTPLADTPPSQGDTPLGRLPWADTPSRPPRQITPLADTTSWILRDMVNKQVVRILLECILVYLLLPPTNGVWGKVIFLHLFVILFTGGNVCGCSQGACMVAPGGHAWLLPGGACVVAPRGHAWLLWGACMVALGGMHGCSGGACMVALGGHVWLLLGVCAWLLLGGACVGYDEIQRYDQ